MLVSGVSGFRISFTHTKKIVKDTFVLKLKGYCGWTSKIKVSKQFTVKHAEMRESSNLSSVG